MQDPSPELNLSRKQNIAVLIAWSAIALYFAHARSYWGDEMIRLGQEKIGLANGLRSLFAEPSPFSPGELILNWISGTVFSSVLPEEIWGRIPGIGWGVATLALALSFRSLYLSLLVAFSVSLFSLSVEMRPYGSLFFSGAAAFRMLYEPAPKPSLAVNIAAWAALVFSHIYGICFIAFAALLRRQWMKFLFGGAFVIWILNQYRLSNIRAGNASYFLEFFTDIARQTLGTLGNPHKATLVLLPMFLCGAFAETRKNPSRALKAAALLAVAVVGPIVATMKSGYFFVPRQAVGGAFVFLWFASRGFEHCQRRFGKSLTLAFCVLAAAGPWTASIVLHIPPFANQPFHRFREIAKKITMDSVATVLSLDACNRETLVYYLEKQIGRPPLPAKELTLERTPLVKTCWDSGPCLYVLQDMKYCSMGASAFEKGAAIAHLYDSQSPKFDLIVYSLPALDTPGRPSIRTW